MFDHVPTAVAVRDLNARMPDAAERTCKTCADYPDPEEYAYECVLLQQLRDGQATSDSVELHEGRIWTVNRAEGGARLQSGCPAYRRIDYAMFVPALGKRSHFWHTLLCFSRRMRILWINTRLTKQTHSPAWFNV